MTKFIACEDGSYININQVTGFYLNQLSFGWCVFCFIAHDFSDEDQDEDRSWVLVKNLKSEEEAQEWLDKFMEKHGLNIEPITPSRCF